MNDFRIIYAKTPLKYNFIRPIRGFQPPSIAVVGKDLTQAREVIYNGITVEEFIISSSTLLIVRIPESQVGKDLTELRVFATPTRLDGEASIKLGLTIPTQTISGLDRLVQSFLMVLLSTPGSDVFSPSSGGGVLSLIGKSTDKVQSSVASDIAIAVEKTQSELLKNQARNSRLPASERLLSATLDSVKFDPQTTIVSAWISIKNILGEEASVSAAR